MQEDTRWKVVGLNLTAGKLFYRTNSLLKCTFVIILLCSTFIDVMAPRVYVNFSMPVNNSYWNIVAAFTGDGLSIW